MKSEQNYSSKLKICSIPLLLLFVFSFSFYAFESRADISTGLVGHWKFDEGTGTTAADSSGNSNTGTLTNGPTWMTGKIGTGAVNFDGIDDYADIANEANFDFDRTNSFSISAWVKYDPGNGAYYIVSKEQSFGNTPGYALQIDATNSRLRTSIIGATGGTDLIYVGTAINSLSASAWHHVSMTHNGSSQVSGVHLYIDGADMSLTTNSDGLISSPLNDRQVRIGHSPSGGGYFKGSIDEARIYNRVLSASDITELYNYTGGGGTPTPTPTPTATPTPTPTPSATPTPTPPPGGTVTAASCSQTDVQTALNQATAGSTVNIPAGTCSWTSTIFWNAPANVTLKGAGSLTTTGGGDVTVIVDDFSSGNPLMSITTNAVGTFRLAGLTIRGGSGAIKENGMIQINGYSSQVRIDHNHIDKSTYNPQNNGKFMVLGGTIYGVVDHNIIDPGPNIGWVHIVNGYPVGNAVWATDTGFGTANFIFFEDNVLNGVVNPSFSPPIYLGVLTDCHTGGRYVARYNTIIAGGVGQTHPTGHAGDDRGCRAHEIYGNTVTSPYNPATEQPNFAFEYNNSGPALVWGNSVGGVYKNILYFDVIRKDNGTYNQTATPNGWGYCGTAFNGTGSNWDGNTDMSTGYPCLDQPGRGKGDLLTGTFPNEINSTTGTIAWPNQALEPIYEWLNTGDIVSGWGGSWVANQASSRIASNLDYYLHHNNTSCNPNAASCSAGVGSGILAQRPVNCTTGTAWWATDQSSLYKCTATNTWTSYYIPYAYPHPLVSGATPDTTPPSAPTGVSVQ